MNKSAFIKDKIARLSLAQKVGQCFVLGYVGTQITPQILQRLSSYAPAGLRVSMTMRIKSAIYDPYAYNEHFLDRVLRKPIGTVKDFVKGIPTPSCTNEEYCRFLNTLKQATLANGAGLPLHITTDMEGDSSADYFRGGIHYFPSQMGIARSRDVSLASEVAWAVARQLTAIGFNWVHSPVLDVNTNPLNPEIGIRSFSEDPDEVVAYATEALKGYKRGGLVTTGKHYPGRGASAQDAHGELPVIDIKGDELERHLRPFQALVRAGVPCIMTAHTAYPGLDPSGLPATLSKTILTDVLKGRMGFEGTITTDDITMGGIVSEFEVHEACIRSINAGADLILFRDESTLIDEVFPKVVEAAEKGIISEDRLNDAVRRTLSVKYDYGIFDHLNLRDEQQASAGVKDPEVIHIARKAAQKTVSVLRDDAKILPLKKSAKILLVEQVHPLHRDTNDQQCHPGLLWEKMLQHKNDVGMVEATLDYDEDSRRRVLERVDQYDVVVMTSYYFRRFGWTNRDFVKEVMALGKPVVVVANTPYSFAVKPHYPSVVLNYGASWESFEETAKLLFGA